MIPHTKMPTAWVTIALFSLVSTPALAGIMVDDVRGNHNNNGFNTNTLLTVNNNPDRIVIVAFSSAGKTTDPQPTTLTYAGQPMSLLATTPDPFFATKMRSSLYYLLNPPVGTNSVFVQVDNQGPINVQAMSLYNVQQTAPTVVGSTPWPDNTSSISTNLSTTANDSLLVSVTTIGGGSPFLLPGSGVTQHNFQSADGPNNFDQVRAYFGTKEAPTAGSNTMSWSLNTGTNYQGTQTVVALAPTVVPEPTSLALGAILVGLLTTTGCARRFSA